jgi:hypothetical protein
MPMTHQTEDSLDVREGEANKFWFRSDRFFSVENQWFFTTREQRDVGPYSSRTDADHGLSLFIDCRKDPDSNIDHAVSVAIEGNWAVGGFK